MQAHLRARILFLIVSTEESLSKKNSAHHQHINAHKDISLHLSQLTAKKQIANY